MRHIISVNSSGYVDMTSGGGASVSIIHQWQSKKEHVIQVIPGLGIAGTNNGSGDDMCSNNTYGLGPEASLKISVRVYKDYTKIYKDLNLDFIAHVIPFYGYEKWTCYNPITDHYSQGTNEGIAILGEATLGISITVWRFIASGGIMGYPNLIIARVGLGYRLN